MYKTKQRHFHLENSGIVSETFIRDLGHHYNFRHQFGFREPFKNNANYGIESMTYVGRKVWDVVPAKVKRKLSLANFKEYEKVATSKLSLQAFQDIGLHTFYKFISILRLTFAKIQEWFKNIAQV